MPSPLYMAEAEIARKDWQALGRRVRRVRCVCSIPSPKGTRERRANQGMTRADTEPRPDRWLQGEIG